MTTRSYTRVRNLALLTLLAIAGCKSSCEPSTKTSSATDSIELTGSAPTYVELSSAAVAPTGSGACKDGLILVAAGSTGGDPQNLLMGPVQPPFATSYDLAEWIYDTSTWNKLGTGSLPAPPTPSTDAPEGSDSQAARLANGDLLLMWSGSTKSALSGNQPSWWNDWGPSGMPSGFSSRFPTGDRAGFRSAQLFWRYSCSNGQWSSTPGMLDSGSAVVLVPDPNNAQSTQVQVGFCGELSPGVGGFDRPELFVDPWGVDPQDAAKQRILVSTLCRRTTGDSILVFTSPDSGLTWEPSGINLKSDLPVVMTSTVNGRVLFLTPVGQIPVIYWSDDKGKTLASPVEGYDVTYQYPDVEPGQPDPHAGEQKKYPLAMLGSDVTGVGPTQAAVLSLARTGLNAALAVYPAVESVNVNGKQIDRQVAAVVWVLTKGPGQDPAVIPIKIIRAQAPEGSVLMATFIEDDSPGQNVATSLLYWLETASRPTGPTDTSAVKMLARYVLFSGIVPTEERFLSEPEGWSLKNRIAYDAMGDYMKGSFYAHNDTLNFVAVWPQVPASVASQDRSQVRMRVISFKPNAAVAPQGTPPPEKMFGAAPAKKVSPEATTMRRPKLQQKLRTPRIEKQ